LNKDISKGKEDLEEVASLKEQLRVQALEFQSHAAKLQDV
jgi:hypothetical protein